MYFSSVSVTTEPFRAQDNERVSNSIEWSDMRAKNKKNERTKKLYNSYTPCNIHTQFYTYSERTAVRCSNKYGMRLDLLPVSLVEFLKTNGREVRSQSRTSFVFWYNFVRFTWNASGQHKTRWQEEEWLAWMVRASDRANSRAHTYICIIRLYM